jgi:competence protein ComEC
MGGLAFVAQALGREYVARWGLLVGSLGMLALWPWLIADASFQLSVTATAGILWGAPKVRIKANNAILSSVAVDLSTTVAAILATLPVMLLRFGQVSIIAPIANMLVLWLIAPLMVLGAVIVGLGLISLPLAQVVAWIAWPCLDLFVTLVRFTGSWSHASMTVGGLNWWLAAGWWLLLWAWWR